MCKLLSCVSVFHVLRVRILSKFSGLQQCLEANDKRVKINRRPALWIATRSNRPHEFDAGVRLRQEG
jgi:hypothetical protein